MRNSHRNSGGRGGPAGTSIGGIDPKSKARLGTLPEIRRRERIRRELYREDEKEARGKVSLPRFSWDKP